MTQAAPDNQFLQPKSEDPKEKPWKGKCSYGCYHAKGKKKKCKCRCSGKLHGRAREEHIEKLRIVEPEEEINAESLN
jgi:hypothetical protein